MDFFSDGVTEEIILALAKIEQLKVISRTSSFFFKAHPAPIEEIGKKLDVNIILEGSIRLRGDMLRISAQLIEVDQDSHLWSETWNRKLENLFDIQDEISLLIADKIREHSGHLSFSDRLVKQQTKDLNAYQHYLKGRFHFHKWNPEDNNIAIKEFEKAAAIDDQMIEAQIGLADAYSFMAVAGFAPRESAWGKAIAAMDAAKRLDENNPGLNYMMANQAFFTDADYDKARRLVLKSLEHAPTFEKSHRFLSFLYVLNSDYKQAKKHLFFAKSIDPLNPETSFYEAFFYHRTGEHALAEDILDKLLTANQMNLPGLVISIYLKIKEKKWREALQQIEQAPKALFTPDERLGMLCLVEVTKGNTDSPLLTELLQNAKDPAAHHAHSYAFILHSMLGQFEQAYAMLQNLFDHKSSILLLSFSNPLSQNIQSTPAYQTYHRKLYPPLTAPKAAKPNKAPKADEASTRQDLAQLQQRMTVEQAFLNPALSLRSLANSLGIHPNQLSWLLNQVLGKNFNEYVNQHRVAHFKKLVVDPANAHISLIGLAYESGFKSKTVFHTAFKKETGMTPKEYQKSQQA